MFNKTVRLLIVIMTNSLLLLSPFLHVVLANEIPGKRSVCVFSPYYWQFGDTGESIIEWVTSNHDYTVHIYKQYSERTSPLITLTDFDTVCKSNAYGILYIHTHGGQNVLAIESYPGTPGGEAARDIAYQNYLNSGWTTDEIGKSHTASTFIVWDYETSYLIYVKSPFFSRLKMPDSIVYLGACYSDTLSDEFIGTDKARVFFGYQSVTQEVYVAGQKVYSEIEEDIKPIWYHMGGFWGEKRNYTVSEAYAENAVYGPNLVVRYENDSARNMIIYTEIGEGAPNPQLFIDCYNRNGGLGTLGYPINEVHRWCDGYIQDFRGGEGYESAIMQPDGISEAYAVYGDIWQRYKDSDLNGACGILGYPLSDEAEGSPSSISGARCRYNNFEGGVIEHHATGLRAGTTVWLGHGIKNKWGDLDPAYGASILGLPISDERPANQSPYGTTGIVVGFEGGHIHWYRNGTYANQAFVTHGQLDKYYEENYGSGKWLGFPINDQFINQLGYPQCNFEGGYITTTNGIDYEAVSYMPSYIEVTGPASVDESSGAQYTCTAYWSDGTSTNVSSSASWSENSAYVTISSNGYLTTNAVSSNQSCRITASYLGETDYQDITIRNISATLSYIEVTGPASVDENSGAQYTCTAYWSDGTSTNVSSSASWSENSAYVTISSNGYLTTNAVSSNQSCRITASYLGETDYQDITIRNISATLSYIEVTGPASVDENSGAQYTCTAYWSDGTSTNVSSSASWSENSAYVTISSNGYLTTNAVSSNQSCRITASYLGETDYQDITIRNISATLSYIEVTGPASVDENSGAQYTCTAYWSDGTSTNVSSSASWSENSAYVTISSNGYLTTNAVSSNQSCRITASYLGETDYQDITIRNISATLSYIEVTGPASVDENSGAQYTCTAYWSDGTSTNVSSSASWSENSAYVTISSNGYLTTNAVSSNQSCRITASYSGEIDYFYIDIINVDTPPEIDYIEPDQGVNDFQTVINIYGSNFESGARVELHGEPCLKGSVDITGNAYGIYISGNNAYVVGGDSLKAIDISDPASPNILGSCDIDYAFNVYVIGDHAYVTCWPYGLKVVDISDPRNPYVVGSCDTDNAWGLYVLGYYAYVADESWGLKVIDISDPTTPHVVGSCDTGFANDVFVSGNYAYLADGSSGFKVVDISDPTTPHVIGSCDTRRPAWNIYVLGDYAYVTCWDGGLQVIDISDPTNPYVVGSCDTDDAWGIYVSGDYAYVADWQTGLHFIDISNPSFPIITALCNTPGNDHDIFLSNGYAYVASGTSLQVARSIDPCTNITFIDSSTLTAMVPAGIPVGTYDLHVINPSGERDTLYNCFTSIDAADRDGDGILNTEDNCPDEYNPYQHDSDEDGTGNVCDLCTDLDGDGYGREVLDNSECAYPEYDCDDNDPDVSPGTDEICDDIIDNDCDSLRDCADDDCDGFVFEPTNCGVGVCSSEGELKCQGGTEVDTCEPSEPTEDPEVTCDDGLDNDCDGLTDCDDLDCVCVESPEIYSIDPDHGTNDSPIPITVYGANFEDTPRVELHGSGPCIIGSCDTTERARDVYVSGNYAYVADGFYSGLRILDISNPSSPFIEGSCDTPSYAESVYVLNNYAYVGDYGLGLQVINISNPSSPFIEGSCDTPGRAFGVYVSGNYAYVADWGSGFQAINISDPSSPFIEGSCDTPGYAHDVYVSGNYAYVVDGLSGFQVINISNPSSPFIEGSCDTPGDAFGIHVSSGYAYVADKNSGLQVINISNPSSPFIEGSCGTPGEAFGIYVSSGYAYVADKNSGLQVINISDNANPSIINSCNTPGSAWNVYVSDGHAYVADWDSGLQIVKAFYPCTDVTLIDPTELTAKVPEGLSGGMYDLQVINPNGEWDILHNCFTLIDNIPPAPPTGLRIVEDCTTSFLVSIPLCLAWNGNTEPDLAFYTIYYGTSSQNYTHFIDVDKQYPYCLFSEDQFTTGETYYITLTATDLYLNESDFSGELVVFIDPLSTTTTTANPTTTTITATSSSSSTSTTTPTTAPTTVPTTTPTTSPTTVPATTTTAIELTPECEITINPPSAKVLLGEKMQFSASTECDEQEVTGTYVWSVESNTGGNIDEESGLYTAGMNAGTDTVSVTDIDNWDTIATSEVTCSLIWPLAYDRMWGAKKDGNLLLMRVFRDEVLLNTDVGGEYIYMLYDNSLEIAMLLLQEPSLTEQTREVVDELLINVESLLYQDEIEINQDTIENFESLLDNFEMNAGPKLKTAIRKLRGDIRRGEIFEHLGITVTE